MHGELVIYSLWLMVTGCASQNGGDRLGELERDEGPQVMLWTKASPLVISNRYTINRKRAHEEPLCTKAVSIVATSGEKI